MIINGPGISYTEPDIGSEFVPELPDNPRPSIVALCKHCTNRILGKDETLRRMRVGIEKLEKSLG